MNVDDDLALARTMDREINPQRTRSTRRRSQEEQAMPHSNEPHPRSSEPAHTKRQKPDHHPDGVQAAICPPFPASASGDGNGNGSSARAVAHVQLAPAAPELVDSANRPVPTFIWPGSDADFPCLPERENGGQRLLWEAELIGSYVMLPCVNPTHDLCLASSLSISGTILLVQYCPVVQRKRVEGRSRRSRDPAVGERTYE